MLQIEFLAACLPQFVPNGEQKCKIVEAEECAAHEKLVWGQIEADLSAHFHARVYLADDEWDHGVGRWLVDEEEGDDGHNKRKLGKSQALFPHCHYQLLAVSRHRLVVDVP